MTLLVAEQLVAADPPAPLFTEEEQSFWAFQPVTDPPVPPVRDDSWTCSPVDRFILAELEARGVRPAPAADRRTLIRRATFDLTGLPPAPAEVAEFLDDDAPEAFARVVDRLLASAHYGQRYGRHWLDVARYADSNGLDENLAYANAWRYRDYVVSAFNADKPFDRFIHEQLAGDLLTDAADLEGSLERLTATGFLSLGGKMLAEDDPVKMQMDIIDEQVDTIGRAFLGLTLGCARCHAHKYDPIPIEDYYALAGIFKSTRTMDNFTVVARWQERALAPADAIERRDAHARAIAGKKAEISRIAEAASAEILTAARRHVGAYLLAATAQRRLSALVAQAVPLGDLPDSKRLPGAMLIEAEDYSRGNVHKDRETYGREIGVLVNRGEQPNFVEYDVAVDTAGLYQCELRYAAADARPCRLTVNGRLVRGDAAGNVTGSWTPESQRWFVEGFVALRAGNNVLRLEHALAFPHIDKLLLSPARNSRGEPVELPAAGVPADGYEPITELVQQWASFLEKTAADPASPFAVWNEFEKSGAAAALPADGAPSREGAGPTADSEAIRALRSALLADPRPESLPALAARFDEVIAASGALEDVPQDKNSREQSPPARSPVGALLHMVLVNKTGPLAPPKFDEERYPPSIQADLKAQRDELQTLEQSLPSLPETMAVAEDAPQNLRVHLRGSHLTLGAETRRGFPRILTGDAQTPIDERQSGRLPFARWLTAPENPLTRRVIVNRVWQWHLGEGLVRSPDNFGRLGERPTHPALLDHLASELARSGWSLKDLHRRIMLSATYRMSTAHDDQAAANDPENRLLWRGNRRRLEAEALRDAILSVAGTLDATLGGTLLPTPNRQYVTSTANVNPIVYDSTRRSVYLPVVRSALYEVFQAFDFADPSTINGRRDSTTVAPQALFMLNSDFVLGQTRRLAARLLDGPEADDARRVAALYELALSRPPSGAEIERCLAFVARYASAAAPEGSPAATRSAWQALCRAVLSSNEFVYVE